jgi:hypothetical protein
MKHSSSAAIPPHDRAAEMAVLGNCMRDPEMIPQVANMLQSSEAFYVYAHRLVWEAIVKIRERGGKADAVALAKVFHNRGKKIEAEVGGPAYLAELWEAGWNAFNVVHVESIFQCWKRRSAIVEVNRLIERVADPSLDLDELLARAAGDFGTLSAASIAGDYRGDVGTLLSDVSESSVEWLWKNRIPLGKLTMIDGNPGDGKSVMTMDLAARITTTGEMPDGETCETGGVVVLNAEDDPSDTILPRIVAAGGDPSRVNVIGMIPCDGGRARRVPALPRDVPLIAAACKRVEAKLVIVDPVMNYLHADAKSNSDQDVRRCLMPLKDMAETLNIAVVIVRHLNKSAGASALYRGAGSIGFVGLCRQALFVGRCPDSPEMRVLAATKSNLGPMADSLQFKLAGDRKGRCVVGWCGTSTHTADDLVAVKKEDEDAGAVDDAKEILASILKDGKMAAADVVKQAARAGVSSMTLRRARIALGVRVRRKGFGAEGKWYWELSPAKQTTAKKGA